MKNKTLWIAEYTTRDFDSGVAAVAAYDAAEARRLVRQSLSNTPTDYIGVVCPLTQVTDFEHTYRVTLQEKTDG